MSAYDLSSTLEEQSVDLFVWFKVIDGPPQKSRPFDWLNDMSVAMGCITSHVELQMANNLVYAASAKHNRVTARERTDHGTVSNEHYWLGYKISISDNEQRCVSRFLREREHYPYSMADNFLSYIPKLIPKRSEHELNEYTCSSLCFHALCQSQTFEALAILCSKEYAKSSDDDYSVYVRHPTYLMDLLEKMCEYCKRDRRFAGVVTWYAVPKDTYQEQNIRYNQRKHDMMKQNLSASSSSSSSDDDTWENCVVC